MNRRSYVEHLNRISRAGSRYELLPDFDFESYRQRPFVKRGPNCWLMVKGDPNAYGKYYDFRVMDGDVFMPACVAAREWMRYVLPEGLDAYSDLDGWIGNRIPNGLDVVLDAAQRDGLRSEADALSESDNLMRSGE